MLLTEKQRQRQLAAKSNLAGEDSAAHLQDRRSFRVRRNPSGALKWRAGKLWQALIDFRREGDRGKKSDSFLRVSAAAVQLVSEP